MNLHIYTHIPLISFTLNSINANSLKRDSIHRRIIFKL